VTVASMASNAFIGGGDGNVVTKDYSNILGGASNIIIASNSSVLGGSNNTIIGGYSGILGGNGLTLGAKSVGFFANTNNAFFDASLLGNTIAFLGNVDLILSGDDNFEH